MNKDDMIMKAGIIHILDSTVGLPVLSDTEIDLGSELSDFLKAHMEKFTENDDVRHCRFSDSSALMELIKDCSAENFIETSKKICTILYQIMNANPDIPSADVAVVVFAYQGSDYLGILKMNYKTSYTHITTTTQEGNQNNIIPHRAILPSQGQKLSEACIVCLETGDILMTEKKYEINGEKRAYFSELFLVCQAPLSQKAKLDIVTKAVEQVNKKYYGDQDSDRKMEIKHAIYQELEQQGSLKVEEIKEKVFPNSPKMQEDLTEKLEKYNLAADTISPKQEQTVKKFQKQHLTTDTGIEITIPMEQFKDQDVVEFITNSDGTISVLIKNIGKLTAR